MSISFDANKLTLIFLIYPVPKAIEENQVTPFRVRGKQIDFLNYLFCQESKRIII